jgi:hypothetical protein
MRFKTKLTSVNLIEKIYKDFKIINIDSNINLQKLVNRALDLYVKDDEFKKKINNHNDLVQKGSKF